MIREMLIRDEGLRLKPYRCTEGFLTIGVGRNLDVNGISESEAILMLDNDIENCIQQLQSVTAFNHLDDVRKAVLVNMCFNLGISGLINFKKMWEAMGRKEYKTAATEMLDSKWAKQVGKRANRLARMMESGVYQ